MCSQNCSHFPQEVRKFHPASQGRSVNKPTISPITGPSQLAVFLSCFFPHGTLLPFLCSRGAACLCCAVPVETCEDLNRRLHSCRCVSTDRPGQKIHQRCALICSECSKVKGHSPQSGIPEKQNRAGRKFLNLRSRGSFDGL